MSDPITRDNETARQRAVSAGQLTYQHTVTDLWPACVECGIPIRHRGDHMGWRRCGCAGIRWQCGVDGWRRVEWEEAAT